MKDHMAIRFLSPQDAQKVAAGEVIERPANGIKELLENSIDAQATVIELAVHEGGKKSIRITDNGSGMSPDDAHICFERYATSKLESFYELENIHTFGFRGEALASICGVARVTITTKQADAVEGLQLILKEGKVITEKVVSCQTGTTLLVEDLFYNLPARKKFLKATATEWNQISGLFKAFCLRYTHIHFTLYHDNQKIYNCPPVSSLEQRIMQLFDASVAHNLITLEPLHEQDVSVSGVITTPTYGRYDRNGFYFFVNNRLVKNYQLGRAVLKGFNNVLPPNKYPLAVLYLTVNPTQVDVNIHPKKEEVLFLHPQKIESCITQAIRSSLEKHTQTQLHTRTTYPQPRTQQTPIYPTFDPFFERKTSSPAAILTTKQTVPLGIETYTTTNNPLTNDDLQQESFEKNIPIPTVEKAPYTLIGQHKRTYILLEHTNGLLVIDQHAAHERILYEQFKERFGTTETIELLFPVIVTLSDHELAALTAYQQLLEEQGIVCEQFGHNQLRVTAVPVYAKQIPLQELIQEFVSWITEHDAHPGEDFFKKITEKLRAQLACKAAVKAGDILSVSQMEGLLRDLEKTTNRFACPHGRPTQWLLSTYDIEKKFKRVG